MFGTNLDVTVAFCIQCFMYCTQYLCKEEINRNGPKPNLGQEIFEHQKTMNMKVRF